MKKITDVQYESIDEVIVTTYERDLFNEILSKKSPFNKMKQEGREIWKHKATNEEICALENGYRDAWKLWKCEKDAPTLIELDHKDEKIISVYTDALLTVLVYYHKSCRRELNVSLNDDSMKVDKLKIQFPSESYAQKAYRSFREIEEEVAEFVSGANKS
ncbi:MAG: hypothetical protein GOV01_02375 [Candidatus Altiarchaeota archaeon]|nr:hypothetical protein [Candidatus Altiarchaeota archaeon]